MMKRKFGTVVLGSTLALFAQGCPDQPEMACVVPHGTFAATYTAVDGNDECGNPGDALIVQQFFPPKSGADNDKQDIERAYLAIEPQALAGLAVNARDTYGVTDPNATELYAYGNFESTDVDRDVCRAPATSPIAVELPEIPPGEPDPEQPDVPPNPGQAALSMRYEWKNVQFWVKPESAGQFFTAELTLTNNGCTEAYTVRAIYPAVSCMVVDETGAPVTDGEGNPTYDDALCLPYGDPSAGRPKGSGINPEFQTVCDRTLGMCVHTGDVPFSG